MNYTVEVGNVLKDLWNRQELFTCYDITRILQSKSGRSHINHDQVRQEVERVYFNIGFPNGYIRSIGYHLSFNPPPQIYHPISVNYRTYDPDALNPFGSTNVSIALSPTDNNNFVISGKNPLSVKAYAVKVRGKDVWITSRERNRAGRTTKLSLENLYKDKNGPSQLVRSQKTPSAYEIVQYNVLVCPAENAS